MSRTSLSLGIIVSPLFKNVQYSTCSRSVLKLIATNSFNAVVTICCFRMKARYEYVTKLSEEAIQTICEVLDTMDHVVAVDAHRNGTELDSGASRSI